MDTDETETLTAKALILSMSWLSDRELCFISMASKELCESARECHLWLPSLEKLEAGIGLHNRIDLSPWDDPTYDRSHDIQRMRMIPRIQGDQRDPHSFLPHPRDRPARRAVEAPLVLRETQYGSTRFNEVTGKLEDCFHRRNDPVGMGIDIGPGIILIPFSRDKIWVEREFPVECTACQGMTLSNEQELVRHCVHYSHISNATPVKFRIPQEFVDPRHDETYETLDAFHKVRVMAEYRAKVLSFLRAPMDEEGRAKMSNFLKSVKDEVTSIYVDSMNLTAQEHDVALASCTLERVMQVCVEEFAVNDFLGERGMAGYCLQVVLEGWGDFGFFDEDDWKMLCCLVSGWDSSDE